VEIGEGRVGAEVIGEGGLAEEGDWSGSYSKGEEGEKGIC
jgi:hypothetical protein